MEIPGEVNGSTFYFHGSKFTDMEVPMEVNSTNFHGRKAASMEASNSMEASTNFHEN